MNKRLSRFIFRYLPACLFVAYGVTMVILVYQWRVVGFYPSLFRVIAWQLVLALALADRSHLENREQIEILESKIHEALNTVGIRRVEFNDLKRDLDRLRDYIARVDRVDLNPHGEVPENVRRAMNTIVP